MSSKVGNILNDLIETSKDGEEGFRKAAELVSDKSLKTIFLERAEGCKKAVSVLQKHAALYDTEPKQSGSVSGTIHRGWLNIKSMFSGDSDHAILEECERGEDVAKASYAKALSQELPNDIRTIVEHQNEVLLKNHDLIRDLRDKYNTEK
ncbi:MAG: PA2169 family four-helix-bundle protein [Rickettsiaceae bacterium]|jgi:uncharacterized protein (TIGR02284 family)|nr:PA2169 family four-helix-bundle protein [Rickettsiaceae bacterium]